MTPRIGSLFSGYGGLDMAVQAVYGGEVAWYSEIDKHACQVLAAHHPGVPNIGDITAVDWSAVPPIDILTGGYPCQPFSHAGKRAGTHDERHLWPYVRDAIAALRPMVTVLENVDGHRSLGLDVVLGDLAAMGVSARWGVVRAADAGAPHGRKRVFIVVAQPDQQGPQGTDARLDVAARWSDAGGHAAQGDHVAAADADAVGLSQPQHQPWIAGRSSDASVRALTASGDFGQAGGVAAAHPNRHGYGSELHAGGMAGVEGQAAGRAPERQRTRGESDAGGDQPAADAEGWRRGARSGPASTAGGREVAGVGDGGGTALADANGDRSQVIERQQPSVEPRSHADGRSAVDWGKYAPAITRWESVLGRPAPSPTIPGRNGRPRLSPLFVEWMMGLPAGHVTGHDLKPAAELKMLGNGVCPQQAELALRMLAVAA